MIASLSFVVKQGAMEDDWWNKRQLRKRKPKNVTIPYPRSAFKYYEAEAAREIARDDAMPLLGKMQLATEIVRRWQRLSEKQKQIYVDKEEEARKRFEAAWRYANGLSDMKDSTSVGQKRDA